MDKEQKSIERIKLASEMSLQYYKKPLVCTYSGGKDSDVMLELFRRASVPFEVHNSHTTADAPQTVRHIREVFRELELKGIKCNIDYHIQPDGSRMTMWNLIVKNGVPTRKLRFCCRYLKESSLKNRFIATGVRWAESANRSFREEIEPKGIKKSDRSYYMLHDNDKKRIITERCEVRGDMILNPIVDWTDEDIWDFYNAQCKYHNPLYDMGYFRVGCIGCPSAGKQRWKEFADFPKIKDAYIHSFGRMLEERKKRGLTSKWKNEKEVFLWWMEDENIEGQMSFEDFPGVMP